jgi:DNA ligase (NAD+)
MTKEIYYFDMNDYDYEFSYYPKTLIVRKRKKQPLRGEYVVFTGVLSMERDDAMRLAQEMGATVQTRVTRDTTKVVVGSNPGNVKLQAAISNGAKMINETQWNKLVRENT